MTGGSPMTGGNPMTGDAAMVRSETRSEPGGAALTAPGFSADSLGRGLLAVLRYLRPSDGWASVGLLAVNLIVVVWSVEQADWVPTPNLIFLILLAMLTGLVLARVPLWGLLILPVGVVIGLGVIVWQITSFEARGMELANAAELWERLNLWFVAAKTGNINIDREPFAFALMSATWLAGYLAGWVFFRYRNFWGVFVLGGAGLLSNLTLFARRRKRLSGYLSADRAAVDRPGYRLSAGCRSGDAMDSRPTVTWACCPSPIAC